LSLAMMLPLARREASNRAALSRAVRAALVERMAVQWKPPEDFH
jgi:hypothetical protein